MSCYLCGGTEFTPREGVVRDDPSLRVVECPACGLVTLSSQEHIRPGHYEASGMHGEKPPPMEAYVRMGEHDDSRRVRMLEPLLINARVLDFGSGAGGFVQKAQALCADVAGVELERRVHEFWGDKMRLYHSPEEAGGEYDLITAFHVFEHLPDPRAMMRTLAAMLKEKGRLVIEVPSADDALMTLYASDAFRRFTYWSQHLFLFNAETMRRLAVQAGLAVVAIQQFQRYPVSNHLHWLSQRRPGGHEKWSFLNSPELDAAYARALGAAGRCDTIIAHLERQ